MDKAKERYQHQLDRHAERIATFKALATNPRATEHSMEPGEIDLVGHLAAVKAYRQSKSQGQSSGVGLRVAQSQAGDKS